MDALVGGIAPPAPKVHANPLSPWRLLLGVGRSTIGIFAESAFDELILTNRQFGVDSLLVNDPAGARHVLGAAAAKYGRPLSFLRITRPVAGDGLFVAEGAEWKRQRRLLAPVFTPASVEALLPHFIAAGEALVGRLAGAGRANLSAAFHAAALDAVLRALFSQPATGDQAVFAEMVRRYVSGPSRPTPFDGFARKEDDFAFATGARRRFARERVAAVGALIAERRRAAEAREGDLLGSLLAARDPETGAPLSDREVADQSATMLFAGFETTSRLLFWASYLLSLDLAEQGRLRAEVAAFPPERVATLGDLNQWPRLRCVLLEALRLYPPAPNIVREALEDDEICGVPAPKAAQVWISPWVMHRHRRLWPNPTAFLPGRFEGKPSPWTHHEAFLPFGGGPRICIGASFAMAEAQIVLASLLHRFAFTLERDRPVIPVGAITIAPDHEPMFRLEPLA